MAKKMAQTNSHKQMPPPQLEPDFSGQDLFEVVNQVPSVIDSIIHGPPPYKPSNDLFSSWLGLFSKPVVQKKVDEPSSAPFLEALLLRLVITFLDHPKLNRIGKEMLSYIANMYKSPETFNIPEDQYLRLVEHVIRMRHERLRSYLPF